MLLEIQFVVRELNAKVSSITLLHLLHFEVAPEVGCYICIYVFCYIHCFSSQVYIQHLRNKQPDRPRKLVLGLKYKEGRLFTRCFHGWGKHKEAPV